MLNIFQNDAFGVAGMLTAIEKSETVPQRLGGLNLFTPAPIREKVLGIEMRENGISLIKTSLRGEPLAQATQGKRNKRYFETSRIGKGDKILASELAFVTQFGSEEQVLQVQMEISRRLSGPGGLLDDVEATFEHMRLSALNGILLDSNLDVLYNFYDEFSIIENAEIGFNLATVAGGDLEKMVNAQVLRPMRIKAKGARYSEVRAECGPDFFDALIKTPEVRDRRKTARENGEDDNTYLGRVVRFAGVTWEEYVGTDDGTTVAVGADKVKFYPAGLGNTVFEHVMSPGEAFEDIGQLGQRVYAEVNVEQKERPTFANLEAIAYPLFLNKKPEMIFKGRAGA
jgi:hypothetical protein